MGSNNFYRQHAPKEYYNDGITEDGLRLVGTIYLDFPDLVFYACLKDKRQQASYGTSYIFDRKSTEEHRRKAAAVRQ